MSLELYTENLILNFCVGFWVGRPLYPVILEYRILRAFLNTFLNGNIKCHLFQSSSCVENIRKMKLILNLKITSKENLLQIQKYHSAGWRRLGRHKDIPCPWCHDAHPKSWEQTWGKFRPSFTRLSQKHWNIINFSTIKIFPKSDQDRQTVGPSLEHWLYLIAFPASHFPFSSVDLKYQEQLVLIRVQLIFSDFEFLNPKTCEPKSKWHSSGKEHEPSGLYQGNA